MPCAKHLSQHTSDVGSRDVVTHAQHPDSLTDHDIGDKQHVVAVDRAFDQGRRQRGLPDIVLYQVADEDIGIERDHEVVTGVWRRV